MTDWHILNKGFLIEYLVLVESESNAWYNALRQSSLASSNKIS